MFAAAAVRADPPTVADLVKQLGDPKFAGRELAQRELLKRGDAIVPELDRLTKGVDAETAERIAKVRYCLVGYKDDIRRLMRDDLPRYDRSPGQISDKLRVLIGDHQPASGDLLLSLITKSDSEAYQQAWRAFFHTWDSQSAVQIEAYVRETLNVLATHPSQIPAKSGMLVKVAPQLRFGFGCWPAGGGGHPFIFRARASLLIDDKPFAEPLEMAYPTSGRGWFRVPELEPGKHTVLAELNYEFTHKGEKRSGRVRSRPQMVTAGPDDAAEIWAKPLAVREMNYFRAAFRIVRADDSVHPHDPARYDSDPEASVWWRTGSGEWAALSCPRWAVTSTLDVDLCFDAEFRDPRTGKSYPTEPIIVPRGKLNSGPLVPRDFAALARGRTGRVPMKLVLTPSRQVAQFGPGLRHCYPDVIELEDVYLTVVGKTE
jgi:hypothetical protein